MIRWIALLLALFASHAQAATPTQTPQWGWDGATLQYKVGGGAWTVFTAPQLGNNNTWTGTNTFTNTVTISNLPIFTACTGFLFGNAASAVSCSSTIATSFLTGTLLAAQFPALTGDVTTAGGALATTIANNAVTNAKSAQMGANTVKGNPTSGAANASDMSVGSCATNGSALKWTTNSGFGCNTTIDAATLLSGTWAIPGTIGSTTPNTGAFTTLSASSTVSGSGFSTYLASPPAIGGTAAAAGKFTTLTATNATTLAVGTTSIAPLTFQSGTNLTTATAGVAEYDGTVFYNTNSANNRGVWPSEQFVTLTSTRTFTSNTSAQAIFAGGGGPTNGQITLPAGTYAFEMSVQLTGLSGSSHTVSLSFAGAATYSSVHYMSMWGSASGSSNIAVATNAATRIDGAGTDTDTSGGFFVKGIIRLSGSGTVIPQITQGTNSAAAVASVDSFITLHTLGGSAAAFVGNWN